MSDELFQAAQAAERAYLATIMSPAKLRLLADWFDMDDEFKAKMFWPISPPRDQGDEVQRDLRALADALEASGAVTLTKEVIAQSLGAYKWQGGSHDGDCPAEWNSWVCTLNSGHKNLHEAWGGDDAPIAAWGRVEGDD